MSAYRFRRPPRVLRKAQLDNLALVPASLLPFKEQYQQIANELPHGVSLIIRYCWRIARESIHGARSVA